MDTGNLGHTNTRQRMKAYKTKQKNTIQHRKSKKMSCPGACNGSAVLVRYPPSYSYDIVK